MVPDAETLSCICGANDSNVRLIEEHLGIPVFARGNELSIETGDAALRQEFQFIIDRVSDEVAGGGGSQDVLASVLNIGRRCGSKSVSIAIPGGLRTVHPRSFNQAEYIAALRTYDVVFCCGAAGSGKTFLAVAEALRLVLSHQRSRLVVSRPVVEAGESLGFLPGDLEQKLGPYLRPLYDAMDALLPREAARRLVESGAVEAAPLAYMRGRTLSDSVVILDEAQNATRGQMKMFLTRMGEGSKVFVTGDPSQVDLPGGIPSGLVHAVKLLSDVPEIGMVRLGADDGARNPLVKKIVKAYEHEQDEAE